MYSIFEMGVRFSGKILWGLPRVLQRGSGLEVDFSASSTLISHNLTFSVSLILRLWVRIRSGIFEGVLVRLYYLDIFPKKMFRGEFIQGSLSVAQEICRGIFRGEIYDCHRRFIFLSNFYHVIKSLKKYFTDIPGWISNTSSSFVTILLTVPSRPVARGNQ